MSFEHNFCDHDLCVITHWPGAPLGQVLDHPRTVGLVTTTVMRSRLEGAARQVLYPRELLASVSPTPVWDHLDDEHRAHIAESLQRHLTSIATDPLTAAHRVMTGQAWLKSDELDGLIKELEIRAGGKPLPELGDRLRTAPMDRLMVFEPHHRHADSSLWRAAIDAGIRVRLVVDPGLERATRISDQLPVHSFDHAVDVSPAIHAVLAASPARNDSPPSHPLRSSGCVELHQFHGANAGDMPWLTAGLITSAGVTNSSKDLPRLRTNLVTEDRVILVVVPTQREVPDMADRLARHISEPVVQFRTRHDAHAIETCSCILRGLLDDDAAPLRDAVLHHVSRVAPSAIGRAQILLHGITTTGVEHWIQRAAQVLGEDPMLRPVALSLKHLGAKLTSAPRQLFSALSLLIQIDAPRRVSACGDGLAHLSPTIERAAGTSTLRDALTVMDRAGWSPSRPTVFEPGRQRIIVAAVNEIGSVEVDIVILVRAKTRGFPGSDTLPASSSEAAQRVLYGCLCSARESFVVLHRGRNDLLPWASGIEGVTTHAHHLADI